MKILLWCVVLIKKWILHELIHVSYWNGKDSLLAILLYFVLNL